MQQIQMDVGILIFLLAITFSAVFWAIAVSNNPWNNRHYWPRPYYPPQEYYPPPQRSNPLAILLMIIFIAIIVWYVLSFREVRTIRNEVGPHNTFENTTRYEVLPRKTTRDPDNIFLDQKPI